MNRSSFATNSREGKIGAYRNRDAAKSLSQPSLGANTTSTTTTTNQPDKEPLEFLTRHNVSHAGYEDVEEIRALFDENTRIIYNLTDPFIPIHRSYLALKLTTSKNKIVAVVCFDEYPNVPGLPAVGWSHWAATLYNIQDLSTNNTLWAHFVVYDKGYEDDFLFPILNMVFHDFLKKNYALFVIPAGCNDKVPYLHGVSSLVLPDGYTEPTRVQTLRLCVRQDFITQYKVRRAVEEDNDDLVPLIHQFSQRFLQLYGEYYVAEIISRHPEAGRKIIVAEHEGEAVSVLCLNPTVNYEELNDCFDLHVFTGLYKADTAYQEPYDASTKKRNMSVSATTEPQSRKQGSASGRRRSQRTNKSFINPWDVSWTEPSDDWFGDDVFKVDEPSAAQIQIASGHAEMNFSILDNFAILTRAHSSSDAIMSLNRSQVSVGSSGGTEEECPDDVSSCSSGSELPYMGTENAFAIEILASQLKHRPSLSLLIISCFEAYPKRDYCLLMLPHDADYSPIFKYFMRIPPRKYYQHAHELYVCHRGQLAQLRVQIAYPNNEEMVKNFVKQMKYPGEILANYQSSQAESPAPGQERIVTLIALSGKNCKVPIGLAQVAKVSDLNSIKMKYAIGKRTDIRRDNDFCFGYIVNFCISPLFSNHCRYFMREVHRKTGYQTLFFAFNQHDMTEYRIRPMSPTINFTFLVPPRSIQVSVTKTIHEYPEEPYALFVSTPRLMSHTALHVNHRIVVVGASTTAMSFLHSLLTNYKQSNTIVLFNNLVLISTDGLGKPGKHPIRDKLIAHHTVNDWAYLEKIAVTFYVSIVTGALTAIERKEKYVTVNNRVQIPYEYLFLMTGLQYGVPRKKGAKNYLNSKLPRNCFTINTQEDGNRALESLENLIQNHDEPRYEIIIYGHSIDCYCCIAALIEFGVPPTSLLLIEPWARDRYDRGADPPQPNTTIHDFVFQDGDIYAKVVDECVKMGVRTLTGYKLIDWSSNPLTLKFESFTRFNTMSPLCAFLYGEKTVDVNAFRAIYNCGLVFDGRLVIDPNCQTTDPSIYAAGPLTKYSRQLWSDHLVHCFFNSEEIGRLLGNKIRAMLLPVPEKQSDRFKFGRDCWQPSKRMVSMHFEPLITYCELPGRLYYLNVCKPGTQIPWETAMTDQNYGSVLLTGDCANLNLQGYFRLHLDMNRTVETITCLSLQKFEVDKLVLLWGKHEALLNNLVRRFENVYITDLFEYFRKPWCSAIFLDDFPNLERDIMRVMTSLSVVPGDSPLEDLYKLYQQNGFKPLNSEEREMINEKFTDSKYDKEIQNLIMNFIRDNLSILDMYAHPIIVKYILSSYEDSPMFKNV